MFRLDVSVDQEALAVFGHVIGEKIGAGNRGTAVDLKQRPGRGGRKVAFGVDRYGHEHAIGCDVENLLAVTAPAWLSAATSRNLPFSRGARERSNVNLPGVGFI